MGSALDLMKMAARAAQEVPQAAQQLPPTTSLPPMIPQQSSLQQERTPLLGLPSMLANAPPLVPPGFEDTKRMMMNEVVRGRTPRERPLTPRELAAREDLALRREDMEGDAAARERGFGLEEKRLGLGERKLASDIASGERSAAMDERRLKLGEEDLRTSRQKAAGDIFARVGGMAGKTIGGVKPEPAAGLAGMAKQAELRMAFAEKDLALAQDDLAQAVQDEDEVAKEAAKTAVEDARRVMKEVRDEYLKFGTMMADEQMRLKGEGNR